MRGVGTSSTGDGPDTGAGGPERRRRLPPAPVERSTDPEGPEPDLHGSVTVPPMTMEMWEAIDRLRAAAGEVPESGGPGISWDRTRVYLRWYGPVPAAVRAVVDRYAGAPFTVEVVPVPFQPGELLEEAGRLLTAHPEVTGTSPRDDGINVNVDPAVVDAAGGPDHALARHGIVSRFPLFPRAEGPPIPC